MASTIRSALRRTSLSSLRPHISKSKAAAAAPPPSSSFSKGSALPSPNRRFASISRLPVELGCLGGMSLYPLHSVVAAARLTSRLSTTSRCCRDLLQGTLCRTYPGL